MLCYDVCYKRNPWADCMAQKWVQILNQNVQPFWSVSFYQDNVLERHIQQSGRVSTVLFTEIGGP